MLLSRSTWGFLAFTERLRLGIDLPLEALAAEVGLGVNVFARLSCHREDSELCDLSLVVASDLSEAADVNETTSSPELEGRALVCFLSGALFLLRRFFSSELLESIDKLCIGSAQAT